MVLSVLLFAGNLLFFSTISKKFRTFAVANSHIMVYNFYKEKSTNRVYWVDNPNIKGEFLFSFDRHTVFNLFADYPHKLTQEQKEIFDKENPYWAEFFKDRTT